MFLDKLLNRELKVKKDDSLCLYPFFNLMINADGKYKPCCKWSEALHHKGKTLQAPQNSMLEAWQSDELRQLRKDLKSGVKPKKCEVCWNEEKSGIKSMRYDSFDYGMKSDVFKAKIPSRLDIYPSNVCNLKCRICSPEYSNRWIPEARETMGIEQEVHVNLNKKNLDLFYNWLPNIVELGLFGGEPLFMKECVGLLEHCVEKGWSKNITLLINTNGTIYSEKLVRIFKSFKKVLLNFSVDDVEKRFEYQRKGAKWKYTVENIKKYVAHGGYKSTDQIECKMCCTVSSLNVYYLPEYFDWLSQTFPGMHVYLNFLHGPYSLSAKNLPDEVKRLVENNLEKKKDSFNINFEAKQTRTIQNIIDFLALKPNVTFDQFFKEIKRGDKYRKESYETIFPEFYELLLPFKN